jgi:hypothetical protein
MKTLLTIFFYLFLSLVCFGQEFELGGSLNTSSDQRLQNALGIGLQYQQDIIKRVKVGLGVHYNYKNTSFEYIPNVDFDPTRIESEKINASTNRFSVRLNAQYLLKDNEYASLSIGPEISYNNLWGQDHVQKKLGSGVNTDHFTTQNLEFIRNNGLPNLIGFGLISKIEIKNFLTKQLALCFTIRDETLCETSGASLDLGVEEPAFWLGHNFVEFQVGLKYRFKK